MYVYLFYIYIYIHIYISLFIHDKFIHFKYIYLYIKGVKQQLKAESTAHSETHSKLLGAEKEVDSLKKVKIQVEEYRSQCAESAIQVYVPMMTYMYSDIYIYIYVYMDLYVCIHTCI
jgi:hypothetical protein